MSGQRTREVVVVGAGLVGLTTALELRRYGIDVLVLERHPSTSAQPKARRFGFRSMEIFRGLGLDGTVREAARDLAGHDRFASGRTLAAAEQLPLWGGAPMRPDPAQVGPEFPSLIAQDVLEPVLARAAVDAGAEVRFGTEVTAVVPDADGTTVATACGTPERARFVVAADGAHSPIREGLRIRRHGRGAVGAPSVSVYFRADLGDLVRGREFNLCRITHPDASGTVVSIDGRYRWVFGTPAVTGERDWPAVLRAAVGAPVPDLEILSVLEWCPEMRVAQRYRAGRVFLAGDAAHVMPPWAAAGANTGIGDAHNLGWKLAAVLRGEAGEGLLDSYDAERRPAGVFVAEQSCRRTLDPGAAPDPSLAHPFVLSAESVRYAAGALVPGDGDDDTPEPVDEFAPSGRAGTRVPHRWLDDARTVSTLDVGGPGWTVLDGAARSGEPGPGGALACDGWPDGPRSGDFRSGGSWSGVDFLAPDERVLLRPDGIIAWRGTDRSAPERIRRELLDAV